MTEPTRSDGLSFKFFTPVIQNFIALGTLAALSYVSACLNGIQSTLNIQQTSQALTIQRVESLEKRLDASDKILDGARFIIRDNTSQIGQLTESLKQLALNSRPK